MQNLLGRCLAMTLVAGGFTATGDLGWLMRRGARVLSATDVPAPAADDEAPIPVTDGVARLPDALAIPRQPPRGPDLIEIADLRRGDRLQVWLASGTPLVLDIVDPGAGAALLHRGGGERVRIDGPIRRGGTLCFVPLGLAHSAATPSRESLGPVTAVAVGR